MKIKWMTAPRPGNFGDILTPHILDHFNIKYNTVKDKFDTICTGSIAQWAKDGTMVLGSGIMTIRDPICATANWKFVRGPITRNRVLHVGGTCPSIYGDPGLLLPLLQPSMEKKYDVGIVPHYIDYEDIKMKYPKARIINLINGDPLQVAREISECHSIISSSLHGIIAAHSYGIPAAWVKFSDKVKGDDIKFIDHYLAVKAIPELSSVEHPIYTLGNFDIMPIVKIFESLS
jgi:pyruvyltransferase